MTKEIAKLKSEKNLKFVSFIEFCQIELNISSSCLLKYTFIKSFQKSYKKHDNDHNTYMGNVGGLWQ